MGRGVQPYGLVEYGLGVRQPCQVILGGGPAWGAREGKWIRHSAHGLGIQHSRNVRQPYQVTMGGEAGEAGLTGVCRGMGRGGGAWE